MATEVPIPKHRTACDACKRMKIRCEWDSETACHRCTARQLECSVTAKERKKREKKGHNSSDSYLAALEERLKRMEAMIAKSRLSSESEEASRSPEEEVADSPAGVADKLSILKIGDNGTVRFVGSSSGFSIFSPSGLRWITEVTGSPEFALSIAQIMKSEEACENIDDLSSPELWHTIPDQERMPLPPREVAEEYITTVFQGYNSFFPIYDELAFRERFSRQYPVKPQEDLGWYAALNMVCAIGSFTRDHVKYMHGEFSQVDPEHANTPRNRLWWKWFRNASSLFIDLQFRESSLLAVQAMTMMIFLLQTLPNPYPCMVVAGAALRTAQSIGMHRHFEDGFTAAEVEQRRNTFWTLVVMERGMVMRAGRPSLIHDDDIGCDLPKHGVDSAHHYHHLRYTSELSLIVGKSYNRLYSAKASSLSNTERLKWVGALDEELLRWRDSLPEAVRPDHPIKCEKMSTIPVLMLQFNYYNALTLIHRSIMYSALSNSSKESHEPLKDPNLNPRVYSSAAICVNAARSTINLLKTYHPQLPPTGMSMMRIMEHFPLVSCLALFANILKNPRDPQALSDIELMESVSQLFYGTLEDMDYIRENKVLRVFREVNRLATIYVKKARSQGPLKAKRGRDEGEDVEQSVESITPFTHPLASPNPAFSPPPLASYPSVESEPNPFLLPTLSTTTTNSSTFSPSTDPTTSSSYDTIAPDPMFDDSLLMDLNGGDYFMAGDGSWFFPMPSFIGGQSWGMGDGGMEGGSGAGSTGAGTGGEAGKGGDGVWSPKSMEEGRKGSAFGGSGFGKGLMPGGL